MNERAEAEEFLKRLRLYKAGTYLEKIDEQQRGIGLALLFLRHSDRELFAPDIARAPKLSSARVAAMLPSLENLGYITRHSSGEDARKTVVELTEKGLSYSEEVSEHVLQMMETLIHKVGRSDLDEFVRIAERIHDALEEGREEGTISDVCRKKSGKTE